MNSKIENQVKLMHEAIEEIHSIKIIEALFSKIDDSHALQEKKKHQHKYAELMSRLASTIIEDSKQKLVIVEQINDDL